MSQVTTTRERAEKVASEVMMVDPRAPRFGQVVTMTVLLVGIGLREPLIIVVSAVLLDLIVLSRWRFDFYGAIWRRLMVPVVGAPDETESAIPHRFATLVGASMNTFAVLLLFAAPVVDFSALVLAGYTVALMHAGAAALGGVFGYCIGCKMYRQVAFVRRLNLV